MLSEIQLFIRFNDEPRESLRTATRSWRSFRIFANFFARDYVDTISIVWE